MDEFMINKSPSSEALAAAREINPMLNSGLKTTFVYLHIAHNPEEYVQHSERFVETYLQYPPGIEHDLVVVVCGAALDQKAKDIFAPLKCTFIECLQGGWDVSYHQRMAKIIDADFMVGCTSRTYFWKAGWLKRFVEAREQFGEGLYGSAGSFEVSPHIRCCFFGCNPKIFREYPHEIDTRKKTGQFECGKLSFTRWFKGKAFMVTWDGVYRQPEWRIPPNIFRRGDQSNLIAWDKHSRIYANASPRKKKILERQSDGRYTGPFGKVKRAIDSVLL